jgi:peptide/nickel transport system substrate-binding protein
MRKRLIPLALLLVCVLVVTACDSSTPSPTTSAPSQPAATIQAATTPAATNPPITQPSTSTPATASKPAVTTTSSPTTAPSKYGGKIKYIEASGPASPIGYPAESAGAGGSIMQFSLQPMMKEQSGGTYAPCLATSMDINTDSKNPSITIHLRKGVKFSDGTDFNAQALKWNMDAVVAVGMNRSSTDSFKSIEVLDDYTFRFNLNEWSNQLVRIMSSGVVFIVSPTAFEKNGIDWMRWHMVGTGPFIQTDFQRDVSLTYTRNPNYWEEGKPYLDGFQELFVPDVLTRLALFKSGGGEMLNLADDGRNANQLKADGFNIITYQTGATTLVPDSANADSPWSKIKVRQAAEYAIDKEAIVNALGFGYWKPAYQINSPASIAFDPTLSERKYDVGKAKQLLTEAGYPNGFKTTIIAQNTFNRDVLVALQSYLSRVGIQVELQLPTAAAYVDFQLGKFHNALFLMNLLEWANANTQFSTYWGTPSNYFKNVSKPQGWSEALLASKMTPAVDAAATKKLEKMAYDDVMAIPVYCGASLWATTSKVQDTGLGTRGNAAWWEPQDTWLRK